jgi:hypothetical protein
MATSKEAQDALIDAITKMAPNTKRAATLLELAEALAWVRDPTQAHGGLTSVRTG